MRAVVPEGIAHRIQCLATKQCDSIMVSARADIITTASIHACECDALYHHTSAEGGGGFVTLLVRDGGCYRMIVNAQDCWGKSGFENRVSTEKGKNFWQRPVSRVPRWYSPDDLIEKRLCVYHRVTQKSCISDIGNVASFVKSH